MSVYSCGAHMNWLKRVSQRFEDTRYWATQYHRENPQSEWKEDVYQSPDFPHVFLGGEDDFDEAEAMAGQPFCKVIDCRDLPEIGAEDPSWDYGRYLVIQQRFQDKVKYVAEQITSSDCPIYVHCAAGANRSVAVLGAALARLTNKPLDGILGDIRASRSLAGPQDPYYLMALQESPAEAPETKTQRFYELDQDFPLIQPGLPTTAQRELPEDISSDMHLLNDERQWHKAVTTPNSLVKHKEGWIGKVVQPATDPVNGGRVLVEHEFEGRFVQRFYSALELEPAMQMVSPFKRTLGSVLNWLEKVAGPQQKMYFIHKRYANNSNWLIRLADYDEYQDQIEQISRQNPLPFNEWFTGMGGRMYIPFDPQGGVDAEVDEGVQAVLNDIGCVITDYQGGYCQQGNVTLSISKALEKARLQDLQILQEKNARGEIYDIERDTQELEQSFREIMDAFVNSPSRMSKDVQKFYIVISQNPHDIAMMSTGRGWTSCMDLEGGAHSKDIYCEVKEGGLVAYLIRGNDKSIESPLARIAIKRFTNRAGNSIALPENSVYGNEVPGFLETVRQWINERQKIDPGFYNRQGGEYSDTFSKTQLVAPSDPEGIMKWYNGDDPSAQFSTWIVTDELFGEVAADDPEDWQEEKTFDTRKEAEQYVDNRNDDDTWRDYYGGEWSEFDEKTGEYVKERFTISENAHDYRSEMKRDAMKTIISAERGTYPMELIKQIRTDLDFATKNSSPFGRQSRNRNATLRKQFAEKYPELMSSDDYFQMGYREYYSYINNLPEGAEKDQLKAEELETVSAYLQNPMQLFDEDTELTQKIQALRMSTDVNSTVQLTDSLSLRFAVIFDDKILSPLQELFKPIPNQVVQQLVDFANNIENIGLNDENGPIRRKKRNYDTQIIGRIMHAFDMTGSDTPTVQKFYWDVINSPRFGDNHYANDNYSAINVETVGFSIAKLGINGQQFLPWAHTKLQEERAYYTQMQGQGHSEFSANGHGEKQSKKNIERYLYIIDAIQNRTGRSTKYRFS